MKNQGKIILLLSFALIAFAYFIWLVYSTNNRLRVTRTQINRSSQVIQNIQDLYSAIVGAESATRAYVITKDSTFRSQILLLSEEINERIDNTERLVRDSVAKKEVRELQRLIMAKLNFQLGLLASPEQSIPEVTSLRGKYLMDSIKGLIASVRDRELQLLSLRNDENKAVAQESLLTTIIGGVLFLLFIAIILWRLSADMQRRIHAEKELQEFRFRFQGILDNTPLLIFLKDLQGKYMLVNKSFRETVNRTEDQLIGKTDFDFEDQAYAEQYKKSDEEIIRTLKPLEQEEIMETSVGKRHLHYIKFPLLDQDGRIFAISGFGSDVTERKQAEENLRTSEAKMRALLDSTKEGFFLLDHNLNFLLMNEAGKKMMHLATGKRASVGESMMKLVSDPHKQSV
ncbi:MAG TPA: PAS domain-containing protein, partial [Chitinophagaceae bacterium]|nr:PAS domain-containing protein [Chitinophagaceae bacterium]